MLSVTIDRKVNFHDHVCNLRKNVSEKISGMARIFLFMLLNQRKLITNAILMPQIGYCPLVWMNHNRTLITESIVYMGENFGQSTTTANYHFISF